MTELVKHLEKLLLENDCVILPGLGGFLTFYSPARWVEEEGIFLPPLRTIGFNPQLKMNDGLLIQSYMQAYNTTFPDATKRVEDAINELVKTLKEKGKTELHGIGKLSLTFENTYEFQPNEDGILTPELYGLSSFGISEIKPLVLPLPKKENSLSRREQHSKHYEIKINRSFMRHSVAIAAAIIIFFFLSTPAENTYIERENYAHLFSFDAKNALTNSSLTSRSKLFNKSNYYSDESKDLLQDYQTKPKTTKVEHVKKPDIYTPKEENHHSSNPIKEIKASTVKDGKYSVIVASIANLSDAAPLIEKYKREGYPDATVIQGDGRIRISLMSFNDVNEAYYAISILKLEDRFKDAWLLTKK